MSERRPLTVAGFLELLRSDVEGKFPSVRLEGEISAPKSFPSGHVYFTLKDDKASLSCVMWRSTATAPMAAAQSDVYTPRSWPL